MIAYTSLELCSFFVHSATIIGTTISGKSYIRYELCTLYRLSISAMPVVLYSVSHWLKGAHALQWALMVHAPTTYKKYFKMRYVAIATLLLSCIFIGITTIIVLSFDTEVAFIVDGSTKSIEKACRYKATDVTKLQEDSSMRDRLKLAMYIIGDALPALALILCSVGLIVKIKDQLKFRKDQGRSDSNNRNMERIIKVVTINTTIFIAVTIPKCFNFVYSSLEYLPTDIVNNTELHNAIMAERILRCLSVATTCLLFAYLSPEFRNVFTCKKARNSQNPEIPICATAPVKNNKD